MAFSLATCIAGEIGAYNGPYPKAPSAKNFRVSAMVIGTKQCEYADGRSPACFWVDDIFGPVGNRLAMPSDHPAASPRGLFSRGDVGQIYDALGRAVYTTDQYLLRVLPGGSQQPVTQNVCGSHNVYDETYGRLIAVKADVENDATFEQQLNYDYDPVTGRQSRVWTGTNSNAPITDTQYVYDILGRLDAVESHYRFSTQLDADANQSGFQPEVTDYVYDLVGNLAQTRTAGGIVTDYEYDALNRLDLVRHYSDDGDNLWEAQVDDLLSDFDYSVRADGKRTAVTENVYDGTSSKTTSIDWIYDNIGRLTREVYDSSDDALDFTADYLFDLVGNRLAKNTDTDSTPGTFTAYREGGLMSAANVDEAILYHYDLNDRLLSEALDDRTAPNADRFTRYEFGPGADFTTDPVNPFGGDHTTQTKKSVWNNLTGSGSPDEVTGYGYNLQGRMASADVDLDADGHMDRREEYEYDDAGIRVAKTEIVDSNDDGTVDTTTRTDYHVDKQNHTGYAQILEEMQGDIVQKSWTIGHDVFLEAVAANQLRHLLKDGHGSTRQLVDALGNVIQNGQAPQVFAYDAYGIPVGFTLANALTALLYSGEMTDQLTGLQYLRARFYNPATGTFNRLDPFFGNLNDPQSLHKYLYAHGNPVTGVDPSGQNFSIGGMMAGFAIGYTLGVIDAHLAHKSTSQAVLQGMFAGVLCGATGGMAVPVFGAMAGMSLVAQLGILTLFAIQITYMTHLGVEDAIAQGNPNLATFRLTTGWASLLLLPFAARPAHQQVIMSRMAPTTAPSNATVRSLTNQKLLELWSGLEVLTSNRGVTEPAAGSLVPHGRLRLSADVPNGVYKYIIDMNADGWLIPVHEPHSAAVPAGAKVRGAGYTWITNGWANLMRRSGHYMEEVMGFTRTPEESAMYDIAVRETFLSRGIKVQEHLPGIDGLRPPRIPGDRQ